MRRTRTIPALAFAAGALGALTGCLERRLYITSDPPGAIVRLNDVDVGRTPVEVDFEWYGTYDVRLSKDGYEPLATSQKADAPVHEWPGIDLVAMALPVRFKNDVRWHFTLEPSPDDAQGAIDRGREVRAMLPPPPLPETPPETPVMDEPPADVEPTPALEPESAPIEDAPSEDAPAESPQR